VVINIIFLVDTEKTIFDNRSLDGEEEAVWSFGQTLALLLLLIPLRDVIEGMVHRKERNIQERADEANSQLQKAIQTREISSFQHCLELGANPNIVGMYGEI
jgi:hypothetical protein